MSKISNCMTMIQLLSNGRKYSIQELSNELEVKPRMIRLYKVELEKAGIFIDTIRGPYGGYVLNNTIRLSNKKIVKNDMETLNRIESLIEDIDLKKQLIIIKNKIEEMYLEEKTKLKLNKSDLIKFNVLTKAIKEKRKVNILYYSYDKGENERIIHPLDMFLFHSGWGCTAFCEYKQDLRNFELERIKNITLLNNKF